MVRDGIFAEVLVRRRKAYFSRVFRVVRLVRLVFEVFGLLWLAGGGVIRTVRGRAHKPQKHRVLRLPQKLAEGLFLEGFPRRTLSTLSILCFWAFVVGGGGG